MSWTTKGLFSLAILALALETGRGAACDRAYWMVVLVPLIAAVCCAFDDLAGKLQ